MDNYDPADLDGDGEFDAIDIAILEDEVGKSSKRQKGQNTGCCISLFIIGTATTGAVFVIEKLIA